VNRLLKPVILVLATVYFVVDAVLMVIVRPLADWLSERRIFCGLKGFDPFPASLSYASSVCLTAHPA
jgi:hypothetical protein